MKSANLTSHTFWKKMTSHGLNCKQNWIQLYNLNVVVTIESYVFIHTYSYALIHSLKLSSV